MKEVYMKAFVSTERWTESTGGYDPEDSWSRDSTDTTWSFSGVYVAENPKYWEDLEIDISDDMKDKELYCVVAVWSDGDSFGNDIGRNAEIISCHIDKDEAIAASKVLEEENCEGKDLGCGYKAPSYLPWDGYFESLDYIEIV